MRTCLLLCLLAGAVSQDGNLVGNPGFEEGMEGWNVGVSGGERDMVRAEVVPDCHSGKRAAKVNMLTGAHVGSLNPTWFAVEPDQRYEVSLWSRIESLTTNPRPSLRILIQNEDGTHPIKDSGFFRARVTEQWQESRYWYVTPAGAARAYLTFFFHFPGMFYLDDMVMRPR